MNKSVPHARTVWSDSLDDIYTYTDNTLKVMGYVHMYILDCNNI